MYFTIFLDHAIQLPSCFLRLAYDGTQSTFHLSHRRAALPEWKCSPHTRSYSRILSVRLSRLITLMAVSHLRLRSADKISVSSPWFFIILGTQQKVRSFSLDFLFGLLKTKQNSGITRKKWKKYRSIIVYYITTCCFGPPTWRTPKFRDVTVT